MEIQDALKKKQVQQKNNFALQSLENKPSLVVNNHNTVRK